jgi:hypothetical protein
MESSRSGACARASSRSLVALLLAAGLLSCLPRAATATLGWGGFGVGAWPTAAWRPYSSPSSTTHGSPFNRTVTGVTVHPSSAAIVAKTLSLGTIGNLVAGNSGTSSDWQHPTYYAQPSDPVFTLTWTGGGPGSTNGMQIRIPDKARAAGGGDHHLTVVEPDGWEYDFWNVTYKQPGGGVLKYGGGGRTRIDGYGLASGGTAAGFGNLAGVIREQELAAGHINHALFIVVKCTARNTAFGYGEKLMGSSSYVYPATHSGSGCPTDSTSLPPMGAHFVLAMSDAQIAVLAVPWWKKVILTALAHYGGYVGDTGGSGFNFQFESSSTYTSFGWADLLFSLSRGLGLPLWNGLYVYNVASSVDWARYLRVLVPPAP